jgi:hypothetical protein
MAMIPDGGRINESQSGGYATKAPVSATLTAEQRRALAALAGSVNASAFGGNGGYSDPGVQAAMDFMKSNGLDPMMGDSKGQMPIGGVYRQQQEDTRAQVQPTSSSSGASPYDSAIRTMYGMYNRDNNSGLLDLLQQYTNQAQQTGASAIEQLKASLAGQQNPYSGQVAQGVVASNPLEQYMQAGGVGSGGVDALQQLLAASNAQETQAAQGYQDRMGQSWQAQQQGRMGDAASTEAAFQQMLAANMSNAKQQLAQQQQSKRDEMMMQILQMAINGGVDLNKLGVRF